MFTFPSLRNSRVASWEPWSQQSIYDMENHRKSENCQGNDFHEDDDTWIHNSMHVTSIQNYNIHISRNQTQVCAGSNFTKYLVTILDWNSCYFLVGAYICTFICKKGSRGLESDEHSEVMDCLLILIWIGTFHWFCLSCEKSGFYRIMIEWMSSGLRPAINNTHCSNMCNRREKWRASMTTPGRMRCCSCF